MQIPQIIKAITAGQNMTQAQIAAKLGTTPQHFSRRLVNNTFKFADVIQIMQALNADIIIRCNGVEYIATADQEQQPPK